MPFSTSVKVYRLSSSPEKPKPKTNIKGVEKQILSEEEFKTTARTELNYSNSELAELVGVKLNEKQGLYDAICNAHDVIDATPSIKLSPSVVAYLKWFDSLPEEEQEKEMWKRIFGIYEAYGDTGEHYGMSIGSAGADIVHNMREQRERQQE